MINYSIVMRSVNANLFDINQAKSRIKAAEKSLFSVLNGVFPF